MIGSEVGWGEVWDETKNPLLYGASEGEVEGSEVKREIIKMIWKCKDRQSSRFEGTHEEIKYLFYNDSYILTYLSKLSIYLSLSKPYLNISYVLSIMYCKLNIITIPLLCCRWKFRENKSFQQSVNPLISLGKNLMRCT